MNWVKIVEGEIPKLKRNTQVALYSSNSEKHTSAEFHVWENHDGDHDISPSIDYEWWDDWSKCVIENDMVTHYCVIDPLPENA